jgi:DNA-binding PadR family transcriptional regulator
MGGRDRADRYDYSNQLNSNNDAYSQSPGYDDPDDSPNEDSDSASGKGESPERKPEPYSSIRRRILLHLLAHHGEQIRFEASQWTAEFGILRGLSEDDPAEVKRALRALEESRMIFRRTQYVVGYSDPKHVYALTPSGHRKALEFQQDESVSPAPTSAPR